MQLPPKKYFGKTPFARSSEHYHVSLSCHAEQEYIPKHVHENPYLSMNLGGAYLECNSDREEIIKPGSIVVRPAYYEHKNEFSRQRGVCLNIELISQSEQSIMELFEHQELRFDFIEIFQLFSHAFLHYCDDEIDCLITETLLGTEGPSNRNDRLPHWYKKVIDKISEDYMETLLIKDLAKIAGVHPNYLARKFKTISGMTLGAYIRRVRLKKASLMLSSEKSLTQVSMDSGFYDQPHFSRSFRETFDTSPKTLRSLFQG